MRRVLRIAIPILALIGLLVGAWIWQERLIEPTRAEKRPAQQDRGDVLELRVGGDEPRLKVEGTR